MTWGTGLPSLGLSSLIQVGFLRPRGPESDPGAEYLQLGRVARAVPTPRGSGLPLRPRAPGRGTHHGSLMDDSLLPPAAAARAVWAAGHCLSLHTRHPPPPTARAEQGLFLGYFRDFNFPFPVSSLPPDYILGSFWAPGMSLHFPGDIF